MDTLDELLAGLDNPRASTRASRTTSAALNYDELNELMQDLASPVEINQSKSNHAQNRVSQAPSYSEDNNLDNLLDDLTSSSRRNTQQPVRNVQQDRNTQPPNRNTQQPVRNTQSAIQLDDLDELLRNLGPPSSTHVPTPHTSIPPQPKNNSSQFYEPPSQHSYDRQSQAPVRNTLTPSRPAQHSQPPQQQYHPPQQQYHPPPQQQYQPPQQQYQPQQNQPRVQAPTKPAGKVLDGPDLEAMLADINRASTRMDQGGPSSRGECGHCRKPILGEVIQALNRSYHPEHFVCGNCQEPLGTSNFYEQDGLPNCERCYQELFCSRCAHCEEPITGRCITALNRKWHSDHFICAQCLGPFPGGTFFEKEGRPYCENCFHNAFSARCGGCSQSIKGECINALGQQWHPEHFCCHYCQKSFGNGTFYEYGGKPYCETHYHQQTGSLCAGCGKAVSGRMVNALDKKWHPEHFVCSFCMQPLAGGAFTENAGKAYCKECHGKLFG